MLFRSVRLNGRVLGLNKKSSIVQPYGECGIKCQVIPRTQLDREETLGRCQAPRDVPPSPAKLMISRYIEKTFLNV